MKEVLPSLESLRLDIQECRFRFRAAAERRGVARGSDRRTQKAQKSKRGKFRVKAIDPRQGELPFADGEISVTVSIGAAESNPRTRGVDQVIQAADKALYRAKHAGRNRVETAGAARSKTSRLRRSIA